MNIEVGFLLGPDTHYTFQHSIVGEANVPPSASSGVARKASPEGSPLGAQLGYGPQIVQPAVLQKRAE
eukprot:10262203-Alexandrium_andersonii.AAC.1